MDTEDGQVFIKNLAQFVKIHEKSLANALHQRQGSAPAAQSVPSSPITPYPASTTSSLVSAFPFLGLGSRNVKPAKLTLTPHHLFYLLTRFQELGVNVGPMDIRLENLHTEASSATYVSFLNQAQRRQLRNSDRDSIHSVSSIRSVMSTMSSLWSRLGLNSARSESKIERQRQAILDDMKYLYSAFTKVPCLRLSPDHRAPLIAGFEEFPFDSAVPLLAFKNVTVLEITDIDFRQFYGWDRVADQLRSLTIKRGGVEDPTDLLVNVVLDDMDKRRRRSAKVPPSPILPWSAPSPVMKQAELSRANSDSTPLARPLSMGDPGSFGHVSTLDGQRQRSLSPTRFGTSAQRGNSPQRATTPGPGSSYIYSRAGQNILRRSSASSGSTDRANTPRGSSSNLLSFGPMPSTKWRFLRQLSLSDNSLTSMTTMSLAPVAATLQYLDLSHNHFKEIPDCVASLVSLRALNLSHCIIDSLHSLSKSPLPAITTLNLRGNRLSSLAGIQRLLSLERIDLRDNRLTDPTEIARLTGIPGMQEVYVSKNPFAKTHLTYRITIFNLFRSTPGYGQDVSIDHQYPSYSERKQLVDRAPELPTVPVVKSQPIEYPLEPTRPTLTAESPLLYDPFYDKVEISHHRRRSEQGRSSQRRKKITRRRVVPIVQEDATDVPRTSIEQIHPPKESITSVMTDDSTYGSSLNATPLKAQSEAEPETPDEVTKTLEPAMKPMIAVQEAITSSPMIPITSSDTPTPDSAIKSPLESNIELGTSRPSLSATQDEGEIYKKQIEELRSGFGNAWLSALSDESWEDRSSPATAFNSPFSPASPLSPPTGPLRTASQPIVSTGRTLG